MSFNIERGLFKFDFLDHHAVLGIPVNADVKEVRKRYLSIARNLHPDTIKGASEADKKLANQLLSKLVNPAYEQLSQNNRDYVVNLGHLGRRLAGEKSSVPLTSDAAQKLSQAGLNLDNSYKNLVQNLAKKQYESLDQVLERIAQISELNMVYLMLSGGKIGSGVAANKKHPLGNQAAKAPAAKATSGQPGSGNSPNAGTSKGSPLADSGLSRVVEYISRAEGYMAKKNFAKAVLELREALKLDPKNSRTHTLMGVAYLKQNQATMAKVHINKALQLNPKDELALRGKKHLDSLTQTSSKPPATPKSEPSKPPEKPSGGGLFGKMFGGKKK
ncbi:MAG: DnaJ domain-containing protein [Coleofasciculaceae cyanobacterium]